MGRWGCPSRAVGRGLRVGAGTGGECRAGSPVGAAARPRESARLGATPASCERLQRLMISIKPTLSASILAVSASRAFGPLFGFVRGCPACATLIVGNLLSRG